MTLQLQKKAKLGSICLLVRISTTKSLLVTVSPAPLAYEERNPYGNFNQCFELFPGTRTFKSFFEAQGI